MKITLEIPNEHAPALLALLSDLMPVRLEPQADPAEGHPELPLAPGMSVEEWAASRLAKPDDESEEIAETRWAVAGIDAADPLKVEMEAAAPVRDGDAELPFPEDFPELPELPEGYSRWVYRGTFDGINPEKAVNHTCRKIEYWDGCAWCVTAQFSASFHHIEAI